MTARNGINQITKHHILPRSRGGNGNGENILKITRRFHEAWHIVFGNMTPEEAIQFIEIIFFESRKGRKKKKNWRSGDLYALQLRLQKQTIAEENKKVKIKRK